MIERTQSSLDKVRMVATGANQMNLASGCNPNSKNDSHLQLSLSVAMMATVRYKKLLHRPKLSQDGDI